MNNLNDAIKMLVFKRGKKYENVYATLVKEKQVFSSMHELFYLAVSIGYKMKTKENFEPGIDMRAEHFNDVGKMVLYDLYINENGVEALSDSEAIKRFIRNDMVEYAEGGIKVLCEQVFINTWDKENLMLRQDYDNYAEDILAFVNSKYNEFEI